jgi:CRP-like cAMP-binding protein
MTEINTIISELRNLFLFDGVNMNIITMYADSDNLYEKTFPAKSIIADRNNFVKALGYIKNGSVGMYKYKNDTDTSLFLKRSRSGEVFGAASLFGCGNENALTYDTLIKAHTKCEIVFICQPLIDALIRRDSNFSKNYIMFLSQRVRYLNEKLTALSVGSAEAKVARYLLGHGGGVIENINYKLLSSSLDISRATLYRVMCEMSDEGMIEKNDKNVVVTDFEKLRFIMNK